MKSDIQKMLTALIEGNEAAAATYLSKHITEVSKAITESVTENNIETK